MVFIHFSRYTISLCFVGASSGKYLLIELGVQGERGYGSRKLSANPVGQIAGISSDLQSRQANGKRDMVTPQAPVEITTASDGKHV